MQHTHRWNEKVIAAVPYIARYRFSVHYILYSAFNPEEYQKALEQGIVLSSYARVMFVGPGGIGKSSLLHGLMNKPLPEANSTQLADTMTVKPATKKWASAGEDSTSFWREVTDNDEAMELVGLILLVAKTSAGQSCSSRVINEDIKRLTFFSRRLDSAEITDSVISGYQGSTKHVQNIQQKIVDDILAQTIEIAKKNPDAQAPDTEVLMHIWDCGGQAVFLDILPAFLTPRTMFLLFYDARRVTDSCVIRSFHCGKMIDYELQRETTIEMLLEWMASVHAMLVPVIPEEPVPKFPRIIPVGTHGDDPNVNKEEVVHLVNSECEGKAFVPLLRNGVVVDNTTAGQGDKEDPGFCYIRKEVHEFTCKDLTVETPIAWVLFRRVFQKVTKELKAPIILYETVKQIATACNIPTTAISTMMQFYHDLAEFLHYREIQSLQGFVIANPQWLIDQFAKIMAPKGFTQLFKSQSEVRQGHESLWTKLWESGILVQSLYEEVWKNCELPAQSLVDLLVHFLLAAPIHKTPKVTNLRGKAYFISSVLPAFNSQHIEQLHKRIKQTAPLHLIFNTYYVPPGFFCRLVTSLLNSGHFRVAFSEGVYRDHIVMLCGETNHEIDEIILKKYKNSIQVEVIRTRQRQQGGMPFSITCHNILNTINDCFPTILHWLKGIEIEYAFICDCYPKQSNKQHFVRISRSSTTVFCPELRCDRNQYASLTKLHKYWLQISEDKHLVSSICTLIM